MTGEGLWLGLLHCYVMRRGKALEIQEADSHLRGPCPELWVQLLWLLFGTSKHVDGAQLVWGAPRQHRGGAEPQGIAVVLTHKPPSCQPRTDPERSMMSLTGVNAGLGLDGPTQAGCPKDLK